MSQLLVINGPNLNILGSRQPEIYGKDTLETLEANCVKWGKDNAIDVICRQSNYEGEIVDIIQSVGNALPNVTAIILNAGAYTHTSIAIYDAALAASVPLYEIHLSNPYGREGFRKHSYLSSIAKAVICGLGAMGYKVAIEVAAQELHRKNTT